MIEYIHGEILRMTHDGAIVLCGGPGYGLVLPESIRRELEAGDTIKAFVHTYVREDIFRLYGFSSWEDKELFTVLLSIAGIGPSIALPMVDAIGAEDLLVAAQTESVDALKGIKGVGAKKAKRILIDVKAKLENRPDLIGHAGTAKRSAVRSTGATHKAASPMYGDLESALSNLGYREKEYKPVIEAVVGQHAEADLHTLLKLALQELAGGVKGQSSIFREPSL